MQLNAVIPMSTLDPEGPLDDLSWLDRLVGDARVVAIGESSHYNGETYRLRHRIQRYLHERHGFALYAMETGYVESQQVQAWLDHGGDLGDVQANGFTGLMGLWTEMGDHLRTLIRFSGVDLPGSNANLGPGLEAVAAYLRSVGYEVDPELRESASYGAISPFSAPAAVAAYAQLDDKDGFTASLSRLQTHLAASSFDYEKVTGKEAYERALRAMSLTMTLDAVAHEAADGNMNSVMLYRDAAIADTVEHLLRNEDRIIVAAHNGHIQRYKGTLPGMGPITPMGLHLANRLGEAYVPIGITTGAGQALTNGPEFYAGKLFSDLGDPDPETLDGVMAASHDGLFAVDLKTLGDEDRETLKAVTRQRFGFYDCDIDVLQAYDALIHLPHVSPAHPDADALAHSPEEVQKAFAAWAAN